METLDWRRSYLTTIEAEIKELRRRRDLGSWEKVEVDGETLYLDELDPGDLLDVARRRAESYTNQAINRHNANVERRRWQSPRSPRP